VDARRVHVHCGKYSPEKKGTFVKVVKEYV